MSKSATGRQFRTVNVDEYDEDKYVEQEESDTGDQGPNENEVTNFLAQGKNIDALHAVLKNAPQGSKNQQLKDNVVQLVIRVLTSFKTIEIEKGVKSLDDKTLDLLMKYVYRGFEFPSEGSSAILLTWHEKVYEVGGHGCIVRVLTDRKHV